MCSYVHTRLLGLDIQNAMRCKDQGFYIFVCSYTFPWILIHGIYIYTQFNFNFNTCPYKYIECTQIFIYQCGDLCRLLNVYVCGCVCLYVGVCVLVYACLCVCVCVCARARACVCVCVWVGGWVCVWVDVGWVLVYGWACVNVCVHI